MEPRKRKISLRKILQAVVTLVVVTVCAFAVLAASGERDMRSVQDVRVQISNAEICGFLSEDKVREALLKKKKPELARTPASRVDLHALEGSIASNPWVSEAEVYLDNALVLHVELTQRVPAFRVFEKGGSSYYVDTALQTMPLSPDYTHYTMVVTQVPELKHDSLGDGLKESMLKMVRAVTEDTFWNAQTAEIRLMADGGFELVPVIGRHRIRMGDTAAIGSKLDNVRAFYRQVLNRVGWDRYDVINASYRDQIVASPSLPWKPPRDRAMSNMSWVKSIMGDAPVDNSAGAMTQREPAAPAGPKPQGR